MKLYLRLYHIFDISFATYMQAFFLTIYFLFTFIHSIIYNQPYLRLFYIPVCLSHGFLTVFPCIHQIRIEPSKYPKSRSFCCSFHCYHPHLVKQFFNYLLFPPDTKALTASPPASSVDHLHMPSSSDLSNVQKTLPCQIQSVFQ